MALRPGSLIHPQHRAHKHQPRQRQHHHERPNPAPGPTHRSMTPDIRSRSGLPHPSADPRATLSPAAACSLQAGWRPYSASATRPRRSGCARHAARCQIVRRFTKARGIATMKSRCWSISGHVVCRSWCRPCGAALAASNSATRAKPTPRSGTTGHALRHRHRSREHRSRSTSRSLF